MSILRIENLTFTYPGREISAVKNINLNIKKGSFVLLCGKSGCGKTTLIKHFKPPLTPYGKKTGRILFNNEPLENLSDLEQAQSIGYVLQNPDNQIVTDKVWHELAFGLESLGKSENEIRLRVAEMANFFGIQNWFHKKVETLSGGQKQLLNLASVMAMGPDVLILDEPTSQLDPIAAVDFLETLNKINAELGVTIILTEHRLEEVFKFVDTVVVLDKGKIIAMDAPKKICKYLFEHNHPMKCALPAPSRIWGELGLSEDFPLTIKEGRLKMEQHFLSVTDNLANLKLNNSSEQPKLLDSAEKILELKEIFFRYEKNGLDIIKNLTLNVYKGELYSIVGGNGAGKSTTLSIIANLKKAYRGKLKFKADKICMLPQDPQTLFVKNNVYDDLLDVFTNIKIKNLNEIEVEKQIRDVAKLVEVEQYLNCHPYDLSGGEQQRVALAKILLLDPNILLLDEPTKGLDAHFKITFANILKKLMSQGKTIIMVSHDIEFCAEYSTRCGLFFDGTIIAQGTPKNFFANNHFYTTSSNRMARNVFKNAITVKDVVSLAKAF
ncbi:MAG: cobalt ABC transporter ATP-binding protein [Candidatus Epulonipiscioides saccharophilum]|nr:MAG: cobalt ABC transporter ATP-binding protein [Epulopiscium sp. AS2M-Bin001]